MTADTILLLVLAVVWWVPTFVAMADLQRRTGLPRPLVWRWTATLCVPVIGAVLYFRRGRPALDAQRDARPGARRDGTSRSGVRGGARPDSARRDGARRDGPRGDRAGGRRRGDRPGSGPGGRR